MSQNAASRPAHPLPVGEEGAGAKPFSRTAKDGSASRAIVLNPLQQSHPTAVTCPEMPAVRVERESQHSSPEGARLSWVDFLAEDPITEQTGRATDLGPAPNTLQKRDRALLLRMDGVHAGQVQALEGGVITIGRHPKNSLSVDDTGVSRFHAEIHCDGGGYRLVDKGARNGSIVQGDPVIGSRKIQDGDFIQLGPRVGFRFSLTDIKQERLLRRLYESSNRDALTGAYNRKHFDERLLSEIAYAARHNTSTSLLLFDIDHFKKVNDTHGHAAGDAVLRQIAGITQSRLRTEDLLARIGGEEFAVLLRGVDLAGSARLAERLRTSISTHPYLYAGKPIPVTISLGCASLDCVSEKSSSGIVQLADERLYKAKNGGRNQVVSD